MPVRLDLAPSAWPNAATKAAAAGLLTAFLLVTAARTIALVWPSAQLLSGLTPLCLQTLGAYAMEEAAPSSRPRAVAEVLSKDALGHIPGKQVSVARVKFPPDGLSPRHYHGGSVTIYVLSGTIRSQLEGQPPQVYHAGETFFEPLGAVHLFAENVSHTEPAEILAVFVHDEGAQLTTYF